MCGIAGIISHRPTSEIRTKLEAAVNCLRHRGPESQGVWLNENNTVALGHRRLSIIDLSEAAAQPMRYAERYTIIHNGELYNYTEIRSTLQKQGYSFTTASDTEVIVAAYAAWGTACLEHFDGMFAFAIWDEKEKTLFAARDRFGEKPFFFSYDDDQLIFASEIKSLWTLGVEKEVNRSMIYNFLAIGYTGNPSDPQETFFNGVYKLPAASFLLYTFPDKKLETDKYWQIYPEINHSIAPSEAIEQFTHLFSESVKKRLRSDVPVGTSLSGGLDSSAVVAFCDDIQSSQYSHKCFTASFEGFEKDETQYAKAVASQYGLDHIFVTLSPLEIVPLMEKVMHHQEEPFGSASVLAQYKVYQTARQNNVTVLLDGQGADELLAGYHKYYKWYWQELFRNKKLKSSKELEAARALGVKENFLLKEKIAALFPDFAMALLQTRKAKQAFRHPDFDRDFAFINKRNLYYSVPASFDLNGALYFNSFTNGLEELLRLADRNSMAHGAEIRLPFLSHDLANFLFSLPPDLKIHEGWTKWILRKSVENKLPPTIVWRKDKTGFEPPQKEWMMLPEVQEAIMEGKKKLVDEKILSAEVLKKVKPHTAYAASGMDWKYWSASYIF